MVPTTGAASGELRLDTEIFYQFCTQPQREDANQNAPTQSNFRTNPYSNVEVTDELEEVRSD